MSSDIILSLDASSTSTGWAVFDNKGLSAYGVIKPQGEDWRDRLVHQGPKLKEIINKYHPTKIVMEDVPLKSSGGLKVLVLLGAVQGFIYGIASSYELPVKFVSPTTWRSSMGFYDGTEDGKKRDVMKKKAIEYANKEFGLNLKYVSPKSKQNQDDTAEAICIGYSQIKKRKFGKQKEI